MTKRTFTIEQTYDVPHFRHVTVEAETVEEAIRLAREDDNWDGQKEDFDCCSDVRITGIWEGDQAYAGEALPIPHDLEIEN